MQAQECRDMLETLSGKWGRAFQFRLILFTLVALETENVETSHPVEKTGIILGLEGELKV